MSDESQLARRFSFVRRPLPVPGDLRINWRLAVLVLMLGMSRGKRASLVKLHVLNDALRSRTSFERLKGVIDGQLEPAALRMRVEPALGRAIDFLVGEGLAEWTAVSGKAGLSLLPKGTELHDKLKAGDAAMEIEKEALSQLSMALKEELVSRMVGQRRGVSNA